VAARSIQGIGGAVASAVSLSADDDPVHRARRAAKAMGVFASSRRAEARSASCSAAVLTNSLDWHWIFLVNLPIVPPSSHCRLKLLRPRAPT